jgi:amidase
MTPPALNEWTLGELASGISNGTVSSTALLESCLARIEARDTTVKAWAYVDARAALEQARRLDEERPRSPLHGIPIGVKDIIDTVDMPTTYGSEVFAAHHPDQDAACVSRLRNAGAVILGKTVTTEFAYFAPGATTNPHNPSHTPGGSSSGSAAAVADFQVPIALGSQTAGSIIRPAAFTGVIGYKPSYAAYPLDGVLPVAPSLDTLGFFTRALEDLPLADSVLAQSNVFPASTSTARRPRKVAVVRGREWHRGTAAMHTAFDAFVRRMQSEGLDCKFVEPPQMSQIIAAQTDLMAYESVGTLGPIAAEFGEAIKPETRSLVERGRRIDENFKQLLAVARGLSEEMLDEIFSGHDVVVTPSAAGEAPAGLDATGDPMFNRLWTFCGVPCINVPMARGAENLPVGVQFVGNRETDADLIAVALYLNRFCDYCIAPPRG